ncbi:hypothetical protein IEE94_10905 [Yimella sp. cx-573]|nr:hypothetical protein [Yimella sp. cx-573]
MPSKCPWRSVIERPVRPQRSVLRVCEFRCQAKGCAWSTSPEKCGRRPTASRNIVIAHDASCFIDWFDPVAKEQVAPKWNFRHISQDVIPALVEGGLTTEDIDTILVKNPRRYFE